MTQRLSNLGLMAEYDCNGLVKVACKWEMWCLTFFPFDVLALSHAGVAASSSGMRAFVGVCIYVHRKGIRYSISYSASPPTICSVLPWVLPAQESRTVLLRAVHQLRPLAPPPHFASLTYEEPHGGAEASGHEAIEGSHRVDVDGVVRERRVLGRAHADS
jgi:hypothetical protein